MLKEFKNALQKLKKYEANTVLKSLYGLFLKEGEKGRLYDICIKYKIPINYPSLFEDNKHYYLWGISNEGVGLIGIIIMNYLSKNNGIIFHSLDNLEKYLKNH